jgi:hypothetical protein
MSLRAKAKESGAEAVKASHQASLATAQLNEQVIQLERSVEQTDAAAEVARLQHEITNDELEALKLRADSGGSEANGVVVTLAETSGSQIEERAQYVDYLNAEWEHKKAELSLMRAIGTLADWAKAALTLAPANHP